MLYNMDYPYIGVNGLHRQEVTFNEAVVLKKIEANRGDRETGPMDQRFLNRVMLGQLCRQCHFCDHPCLLWWAPGVCDEPPAHSCSHNWHR